MRAKRTRKREAARPDPKKENLLRDLSQWFRTVGFEVRREALKRGHGWRAVSGACRAGDHHLIFVDRRMSQDEQVAFLVNRIAGIANGLEKDRLDALPDPVRSKISDVVDSAQEDLRERSDDGEDPPPPPVDTSGAVDERAPLA